MKNICDIDVHKDSIFMCIIKKNGDKVEEKFGVLTPELDRLRDLLVYHSVGDIAMESTSIYWVPIWRVLYSDFNIKIVNHKNIKKAYLLYRSVYFFVRESLFIKCDLSIKRILKFNTGKVYYEHMFIIFAEKYRSTNNINHYISTL
jgi:hypothetical protein